MTKPPQGTNTPLQPSKGNCHGAPIVLFGDIYAINRIPLQPDISIGEVTKNPCRALHKQFYRSNMHPRKQLTEKSYLYLI